MTAHTPTLLQQGHEAFLACGDVYRRDEVDATHYPVFYQVDGVRVIKREEYEAFLQSDEYREMKKRWEEEQANKQDTSSSSAAAEGATDASIKMVHSFQDYVVYDLQKTLGGLAKHLFGQNTDLYWNVDTFPFTEPSYELEVNHNGKLLELLGSGILKAQIMQNCGFEQKTQGDDPNVQEEHLAWAFGIGLERIAMKYFEIPDIRLFWTEDERFISQFERGGIDTKFEPYSKYPPCYKDISFWVPSENFHDNDFYEAVREIGGDLVESVEVVDQFFHPKKKRLSMCYRINYRSMDRNLTNAEINDIQTRVIEESVSRLGCEIRDGTKVG